MTYERNGDTLTVHLQRDFNLLTARHLRQIVHEETHVRVDLSRARLVDTEALYALYELQSKDMHITLIDPPELYHEVVEVLDLQDVFDVEVADPGRFPRNV